MAVVGISAGLSVPFILIAFSQDQFSNWTRHLIPRLNSAIAISLVITVGTAARLAILWTSSLASTSKVGATIGIAILCVMSLVAAGIYRLLHVAGRADTTSDSSEEIVAD